MAPRVKHPFHSDTPDSATPGEIKPSHWNEDHDVEQTGPALLGKTTPGEGAVEEIPLGEGLEFQSGELVSTEPVAAAHAARIDNPHSVTKSQVGLGNVTNDAQLKRSAADWATFSAKSTPVNADEFLIEDSAASGAKKRVLWSAIVSTLTTAFNALYQPLATILTAISNLASNGLIARTGSGTVAVRTITGTANQIGVTNGDGASGNPTISAVIASQAQAEAGSDNTSLITSLRVAQAINAQLATVPQAEAEAGTATTRRAWTAQRVAQAIAALASGSATPPPTTQYFTSPGTWIRPAGCKRIKVLVVAGGGLGGADFDPPGPAIAVAGNGGSSGGGAIKTFPDVTPPAFASAPVTVGAGGSPSSTSGGPSNFGSAPQGPVSATGGVTGPTSRGVRAPGGTGSGGDLNIKGDDGAAGGVLGSGPSASPQAKGGAPTFMQFGGGGDGANPSIPVGRENGQPGIVIVEEFY